MGSGPGTGGLVARARSAKSSTRELAGKAQDRLERERQRHLAVAAGFAMLDRSRQTAASLLSGALAFRFFLTLLPLTLVMVVGLGLLKSTGATPTDALKQFGIRGVLASTIDHSASFRDPGRTVVLLLGILGVLAGARTTAAALRAIHALAWGLPVERWRRSGGATMIFLGVVVVAFACAGIATRIRSAGGFVIGFGASVALAGFVAAVWLGVSWLLPHREGVGWTALIPGAVLVGAGFALLQTFTVNWIGPRLQHKEALYGSLAVSFVVLGWLYVVGRLLVTAPLLNAALVERRERGAEPASHNPSG